MPPHLLGYVDRWSGRAGERIEAMASCSEPSVVARMVRLQGWRGRDEEMVPVDSDLDGTHPAGRQDIALGAMIVMTVPALSSLRHLDLSLWLRAGPVASEVAGAAAGVLALGSSDGSAGLALLLDEVGALRLRVAGHTSAALRLRPGAWTRVSLKVAAGQAALTIRERDGPGSPGFEGPSPGGLRMALPLSLVMGDTVVIGAAGAILGPRGWVPVAPMTASVARVVLRDGDDPTSVLAAPTVLSGPPARLTDTGSQGTSLHVVNSPLVGVPGPDWDGTAMSRRERPDHYDAVRLHHDALDDARWEPLASGAIPNAPSGVYAVELTAAGGLRDVVPFFLLPPPGSRHSLAFLAPTFTYQAYANLQPDTPRAAGGSMPPDAPGALGLSLYDRHADGEGVSLSSRRRPVLTLRPGWLTPGGPADGFRNFPGDLMILDWLAAQGSSPAILTDEALHQQGRGLLDGVDCLVTGCHPEYWTAPMLTALEGWLADDGRLLYMGGNGFYWVTSVDPDRAHVIEVRRGVAGCRTWEASPGELHHLTTGEFGGLWRHRGHRPHEIVGVGFSGIGWAPGMPYRLGAVPADLAWIQDGVRDPLGDCGLILGAAAGDEVDSADAVLGTPLGTVVVASATLPVETYQGVPENALTMPERPVAPRADAAIRLYPNGGAVFAAGSIAWAGALSEDPGGVGRLTRNVLDRFMDRSRPLREEPR